MKTRFIPALITLLAAACVSVINIVNKTELVPGLRNLLIVIVVFYILGTIGKVVINRSIEKKEETTDTNIQSSEEATAVEDSGTNDKADEKVE